MRTTARKRRCLPAECTICAFAHRPGGQVESLVLEVPNDLPRHAQSTKRLKQVGQALAHLLVRIQLPGAIGCTHIADR
jgi:hypothetical protein